MKRVVTVAPMPPEKSAYALARYSRSADSIRQSIDWVRSHNTQNFLESFYFQYGHQSIADLGHTVLCFEGISELAASEIGKTKRLWDGQAKSSRYQDFSKSGFITHRADSWGARTISIRGRSSAPRLHRRARSRERISHRQLPRPESMKPDAYARNIAARAFRCGALPFVLGRPHQCRPGYQHPYTRKADQAPADFGVREVRELGDEIAQACAESPACAWNEGISEPLAPTLARHAEPDEYLRQSRADLQLWAAQNLTVEAFDAPQVDLLKPDDMLTEIAATLLYPVCEHAFRAIYENRARLEPGAKSRGARISGPVARQS